MVRFTLNSTYICSDLDRDFISCFPCKPVCGRLTNKSACLNMNRNWISSPPLHWNLAKIRALWLWQEDLEIGISPHLISTPRRLKGAVHGVPMTTNSKKIYVGRRRAKGVNRGCLRRPPNCCSNMEGRVLSVVWTELGLWRKSNLPRVLSAGTCPPFLLFMHSTSGSLHRSQVPTLSRHKWFITKDSGIFLLKDDKNDIFMSIRHRIKLKSLSSVLCCCMIRTANADNLVDAMINQDVVIW